MKSTATGLPTQPVGVLTGRTLRLTVPSVVAFTSAGTSVMFPLASNVSVVPAPGRPLTFVPVALTISNVLGTSALNPMVVAMAPAQTVPLLLLTVATGPAATSMVTVWGALVPAALVSVTSMVT